MNRRIALLSLMTASILTLSGGVLSAQTRQTPSTSGPYFPERFGWQTRTPAQAGVDATRLEAAIKFATENENPATKDLAVDLATTFGREPFDTPIGPVQPRGALNGIIVKNGYIIAEWGETTRTDMTFSVTKSFLSTVVGIAWQKGLIRDVNDLVRDYVPDPTLFASPHNAQDHLGSPAASDQRLAGHPVGEARLGGQTRRAAAVRLAQPAVERTWDTLQIQRRPREPSGAVRTARPSPATSGGAS